MNVNGSANESVGLTTRSPLTAPAQSVQNPPSPLLTPLPAARTACGAVGVQCASEPCHESGSAAFGDAPWSREPERREKKRHSINSGNQGHNWLKAEPREWVGRKVRNRSTAAIYSVRQVFRNNRVQLEKNWMSYMTDVETIRAKYEAYAC